MKTILFILSMTMPLFLAAGTPVPGTDPAMDAYTLVRSDQNIAVYTKWIPLNATISTRKVKAVFSCSADVEDVVALVTNDAAVTQWMSNVEAFNRLRNVSGREWYSYIRYGLPWPLSDQDCVLRYEMEKSADGKSARVFVEGMPLYIPANEGVNRISHLECEWMIYRTGDHHVLVEYTQYSKQPPKFSRKLTDPLVQKALIRSLAAFRTIVEQK